MSEDWNTISTLLQVCDSYGLILRRQLVSAGTVSYLEIYSVAGAEQFLLYIPSATEMAPSPDLPQSKLTEIDLESDELDESKTEAAEETYEKITLGGAPDTSPDSLESSYKLPFSLKDPDKSQNAQLRQIASQLHRFRLALTNVPYKVAIYFHTFLCTIHRSGDIVFYRTKLDHGAQQRLVVSIDLDNFPTHIESIKTDIAHIRNSLYRILEKNQTRHIELFFSLVGTVQQLQANLPRLEQKRQAYIQHLSELEELLLGVIRAETHNQKRLVEEKGRKTDATFDLKKIDEISKLHTERSTIARVKQKVLETITHVRAAKDNLDLRLDNALFEGNVMLGTIRFNLEKLLALLR